MSAGERLDSFQFEFSVTVPADTTEGDEFTVEREVPYDGRITTLVIGWPDGANHYAGVQLLNQDTDNKLFPRDDESEFVGANDFTHPFDLRVDVDQGEVLVAHYVNRDTTNDHFLNVLVTIEERPEGE